MSYWDNWSDGKKWAMGILSALIITAIVSSVTYVFTRPSVQGTEIPGGTGWIFAGYFNMQSGVFTEGPYVSVLSAATRNRTRFIEVGDPISLNVARPVVIVDFLNSGTTRALDHPINAGVITDQHLTGVSLSQGTELVVRDLVEGFMPGNESAALWLRIVSRPK